MDRFPSGFVGVFFMRTTMSLFGTSLYAALHGKTLPKHGLDGQPVRRKVSKRSICWELPLNEFRRVWSASDHLIPQVNDKTQLVLENRGTS